MNSLIPTVLAADPSAHVWDDKNTIWLYTSHDQPGTTTHDTMQSYHVFSSNDMVNWNDYGCVLSLENVKWAISHMWAIDACYRHGKYYLIFCAIEKATGMFRTGLAVSDFPQGPFKDIGFIKGVDWGQDPALFVDDDDTPYLFWGAGSSCHACQLTDDLTEAVPDTIVDLTPQLTWVFEGPFVHKYNNKYYLTYPGLYENKWPEHMYYAIADKPLGPYTFAGEYIPVFEGQAGTNHGSVIEFKNKWYALHHSSWITGNSTARCLMCDYVEYDDEGKILPIIPNKTGVVSTETGESNGKITIILDAAGAEMMRGSLMGTYTDTAVSGYTGMGYVTGFDNAYYGITVMAQSCINRKCHLKIRYNNPGDDSKKKILVNDYLLTPDGRSEEEYDKQFVFCHTDGWQVFDAGIIELTVGENHIRLYNNGEQKSSNILVDKFILEQLD